LHTIPHVHDAHAGVPFGAPGHAFAHLPQFCGEVVRSTHDPAQFASVPLHEEAHAPRSQTSAGAHAFAQLPQ
jgi:hypothetical protein